MNVPALGLHCAACAQAARLKDLDAFVDAQPWHALDEAEANLRWKLLAVQYKALVPDGPPCSWKALRSHYHVHVTSSHMQRCTQLRTLYSMLRQLDASSDPDNPLSNPLYRAQLLREIEALRTQDPPLPAVVRLA